MKWNNYFTSLIWFETVVGLCRDILHKKGVSASKSHRGKHENKWKQSDENFEQKFFLIFLMIFELRNFEEMSFYIPPKWISSNFKVVWNFFEKCYEDKQKFLWKLRHRAFKRTNSHVHTTSRKKVPGIFRKNRSLVYPLE